MADALLTVYILLSHCTLGDLCFLISEWNKCTATVYQDNHDCMPPMQSSASLLTLCIHLGICIKSVHRRRSSCGGDRFLHGVSGNKVGPCLLFLHSPAVQIQTLIAVCVRVCTFLCMCDVQQVRNVRRDSRMYVTGT